jgi:hypothetical protein
MWKTAPVDDQAQLMKKLNTALYKLVLTISIPMPPLEAG